MIIRACTGQPSALQPVNRRPARPQGRSPVPDDLEAERCETLAGILLAAGGATRFGGPKQIARIDGRTLVERAARIMLATCPAGVVVVTGARADAVTASLAGLPARLCHNDAWSTGMAGSIRCGLDALPRGASAALLLLCDQVAVDETDLRRLASTWACAPARVAAARYAGTLGVPAIFPSDFWPELRALQGDHGGRAVIAGRADVVIVDMPHAAVDIDTPAELGQASDN